MPSLPPVSSPVTLGAAPGGVVSAVGPSTSLVSPAGLVPAVASSSITAGALPGSDFIIPGRPKRKTCALVYGDGGTGKSSLAALFCPQPVAFINFDNRADYAIDAARSKGRTIYYCNISMPLGLSRMSTLDVQKVCAEAVRKVLRNFEAAVAASGKGDVRTIALDTGSEFGELLTLAARGTLDNVKGDYGKSKDWINRQWMSLFDAVRGSGVAHFVVLARAQAIWENNEPTGDFKARIHDVVRDAVDWAGHIKIGRKRSTMPAAAMIPSMPIDPAAAAAMAATAPVVSLVSPVVAAGGGTVPRASTLDPASREFQMQITKAGNNNAELGRTYTQEEWEAAGGPFTYACTRLMPGSVPEDWS